MSGGFFRGTSADQDTRFSNKKAKLLKSQKFASELEHLVDISKVKMDVMRPWIANRATELLGFEDEVLINFIYGLLDGKAVNGKEVQISITGFMEKNTGKFMKELWTLLLSAQKNASGVPQQILDAKEEETRTKMEEADRIANEIQKKREKERIEQERLKMDGGAEAKATGAALDLTSKNGMSRISGFHPEDEKGTKGKNGTRGRNSHSPSRSMSKSYSNSRSYSGDRHWSRSVSKSPKARGRSISSERGYHSKRRSFTPRGRHSRGSPSPLGKRAPYSRRRSISRSRYRSPTPVRRRLHSPLRRRSPSPVRRRPYRSPSPMRRRSPSPMRRRYRFARQRSPLSVRRRSPSPVRRRFPSPMRRRSPSPMRRKSPFTARHRSPSPLQCRYQSSSSTPRSRSPSLMQRNRPPSPGCGRSPTFRNRSFTPDQRSSSSPNRSRSPSPVKRRSPMESPRGRNRAHGKLSPVECQPSTSLRSPQRDLKVQNDPRNKLTVLSHSPEKSPDVSGGRRSDSENMSPYENPVRQARDQRSSPPRKPREEKQLHDNQEISVEEKEKHHSRDDGYNKSKKRSVQSSSGGKQKDSTVRDHYVKENTNERLSVSQAKDSRNHPNRMDLKKRDKEMKSESSSWRKGHQESPEHGKAPAVGGDGHKFDEKISRPNNIKGNDDYRNSQSLLVSVEKRDHNDRSAFDSGSEESGWHIVKNKEKRKHRRSERDEDASDDCSDDSEIEDRKETKRRKKEEKKLRKEEKRRRREERDRRKEERHAEKHKLKNQSNDYPSDGDHDARRELHRSNDEETECN